jgi:hypothetical protein
MAQIRGTRPLPSRHFVVGDEVRLVVELRHQFNIDELRLVFVNPLGPTITLIGQPDSTEVVEQNRGKGLDWKRSTAVLVTLIDVDHSPGEYFPHHLVVRTASGYRHQEDLGLEDERIAGVAFQVLAEVDPPDEIVLSFDDPEDVETEPG